MAFRTDNQCSQSRTKRQEAPPTRRTVLTINRQIAKTTESGYPLVTRKRLLDSGLSNRSISNRLISGHLIRMHRGVYALGSVPRDRNAQIMAAILACGDGAVAAHHTAACLWGLVELPLRPIHVSRLMGTDRPPKGVRLHRPRHLAAWELTRKDGIPVTTVARTLADLAIHAPDRLLEDAVSGARQRNLFNPLEIEKVVRSAPRRRGGARLLELVQRWAPVEAPSLSHLQDRIFNLCASAGLPRPEMEVKIGDLIVDFLWPEQKLVMEADGRAHHEHRFDEDRDRDLYLTSRGYRAIRVTYKMIRDNHQEVIRRIREALSFSAPTRTT